jgi:DnaJ-class molecular chaperone
MADLYSTLGVSPNATPAEVKKAYRSKAQQMHPDKNNGNGEEFREVEKAYRILKDPESRARYDETGDTDKPKKPTWRGWLYLIYRSSGRSCKIPLYML